MKTLVIYINAATEPMAELICRELGNAPRMLHKEFRQENAEGMDALVFIGALGICVRSIAPMLRNKYADPAIVCIDSLGKYVISVASGHIGGANDLTRHLASMLGAEPVITTMTDNAGLWALDMLASRFGWVAEASKGEMNKAIFSFTNSEPTALLLDVRDRGTQWMEGSLPSYVTIVKSPEEATPDKFRRLIAVSPFEFEAKVPTLCYRPKVLSLGVGCRKDASPEGVGEYVESQLRANGLSPLSVASVATVELKKDEPLLAELCTRLQARKDIFTSEELARVPVPNPSQRVAEAAGTASVAESAALLSSGRGPLLLPKQKCKLSEGNDFTIAVAESMDACRSGHIEIVGAGPGDPELVSVRGRRFLETADLILYAGSLVPRELTFYAKPGCVVRSSAPLNLEQQFALMKEFYDRGLLVVRLHTGDPCIYGAIEEQMALFDKYGMSYHITPGISSFQAAAAALRSQFTIPERVQTIILTRGEGRTPMPEREQLHKLAQSRSTMCIYLSAGIVEDVERELLQAYPPETPVAACYKLTWRDERIYRGKLKDLAKIVRENNLTLTTLLVVGDAIDCREGLSRLYADEFKHLYRK